MKSKRPRYLDRSELKALRSNDPAHLVLQVYFFAHRDYRPKSNELFINDPNIIRTIKKRFRKLGKKVAKGRVRGSRESEYQKQRYIAGVRDVLLRRDLKFMFGDWQNECMYETVQLSPRTARERRKQLRDLQRVHQERFRERR